MLPPSVCGCSTFSDSDLDFQPPTLCFFNKSSAHFGYKNVYLPGDEWLVNRRWEELFSLRNKLTFVEMVTWQVPAFF